jgi:hypothetical protein
MQYVPGKKTLEYFRSIGARALWIYPKTMRYALICFALLVFSLGISVAFYKADPNAPGPKHPGDVAVIHASYACAPSEQAFDEIEKWVERNDMGEVRRLMLRTHSFILRPDTEVKVLETGLLRYKVRVVGQLGEGDDVGDPRLYRECWTSGDAVRNGTAMEWH